MLALQWRLLTTHFHTNSALFTCVLSLTDTPLLQVSHSEEELEAVRRCSSKNFRVWKFLHPKWLCCSECLRQRLILYQVNNTRVIPGIETKYLIPLCKLFWHRCKFSAEAERKCQVLLSSYHRDKSVREKDRWCEVSNVRVRRREGSVKLRKRCFIIAGLKKKKKNLL